MYKFAIKIINYANHIILNQIISEITYAKKKKFL